MASRYTNPDIQYLDGTGLPLAGAKLFFYTTGTSTKLNTYSDAGLTTPNANPIILDSAGRAGSVFLQNLKYKVILAPATDTDPPSSPIWTEDPVYTADVSTQAQLFSGSGNPNGNVAGTQGSATTLASEYWDYTNNILYVCTTTGNSASAVWTAVNASTAAAVVPAPQGYLTPVSGTPIITSDSIAATTLFYTPYNGLVVPIYNGTSFIPTSIVSELQYTLTANLTANGIFDAYIFSNSGVATLGTGPNWSAGTSGSITAGSCARGTGAGGSALSRLQGILTNAVQMTIRYGNGTTTASVSPNQATYVGSLLMDSVNGQVTCHRSYGQGRKWGIWNAYNRAPIYLKMGDSTATWPYALAAYRQSNASPNNSLLVFTGLQEEFIDLRFVQSVTPNSANGNASIGIGINSTTTPSGFVGWASMAPNSAAGTGNLIAEYQSPPILGYSGINTLESAPTVTSQTFRGTEANMVLQALYRG